MKTPGRGDKKKSTKKFGVSDRAEYISTPERPLRGSLPGEVELPFADLGTVARVKYLKGGRSNDHKKLPIIIDSSGYYILDKSKEDGIGGFLDTITPMAARETILETTRQMNYKGGVNVLVELESITEPDGSETSRTETIAVNTNKYHVLPSSIVLSPVATYTLPRDHENAPFFNSSNLVVLDLDSKRKLCFNSIINAIGFYKIFKESDIYSTKIELIKELVGLLISIGFDFPQLDDMESQSLEAFLKNLKAFCVDSDVFEKVNEIVKDFKVKLGLLDTSNFLEFNSDLIDTTLNNYTNELSPFYYFYRMGVLPKNIQQEEISSPSLNKAGFDRDKKANKQMSDSFIYFLNSIIDKMRQKSSTKEVKENIRENIQELYNSYSRFDSVIKEILDSNGGDLTSLQDSQDFQNLLGDLKNVESKFMKEIGFTHVTVDDALDIFKDSILNGSDSIIDKKFDGNDFAICWDAITNGLPVLTQNADMLTQIRSNLGRAFLLGRDVQIIIIDDLVKYFKIEKEISTFSVADITDKCIWLYCREKLDMNKMWGMTSSAVSKAFEESYFNGGFETITSSDILAELKDHIVESESPDRLAGRSLVKDDAGENPSCKYADKLKVLSANFASIFPDFPTKKKDDGPEDESNHNEKGPGNDSKP